MAIRAVIFDMGGVLVRTEDQIPRILMAKRLGITPEELYRIIFDTPTAVEAAVGKLDVQKHWEAVCTALGRPISEIAAIQQEFWAGDRLNTQLLDFIRSLHPHNKTALLSNAWNDARQIFSEKWHLLDAFDEVIISAEVHLAKPDPRIYALVIERLQVKSAEAVFIDDVLENIEAARKAGLHGVQFIDNTQLLEELKRMLADQ